MLWLQAQGRRADADQGEGGRQPDFLIWEDRKAGPGFAVDESDDDDPGPGAALLGHADSSSEDGSASEGEEGPSASTEAENLEDGAEEEDEQPSGVPAGGAIAAASPQLAQPAAGEQSWDEDQVGVGHREV
jgi:hypothetical protein